MTQKCLVEKKNKDSLIQFLYENKPIVWALDMSQTAMKHFDYRVNLPDLPQLDEVDVSAKISDTEVLGVVL